MKKQIISLCTAGLMLLTLAPGASAVYIGNAGQAQPTATVLQHGYYSGEEDAAGTLSFGNVEGRMRAGNPTLLSVQATLDGQHAFDRKAAYDKLLKAINDTVDGAIALSGGSLAGGAAVSGAVSSMRAQLDAISEKNYAETMEMLDRQLADVMNQIIMAGESLYINIVTTENKLSDLDRTMETLDRTMTEMKLRYELGQISKLSLEEFQATYTATKSQVDGLRLTVETMKSAMQNLLGEPVTGKITLQPLPSISDMQKQTAQMDADKALTIAKEKSFTLFDAAKTLEDAEDDWKDAKRASFPGGYSYKMAEQTWQSAQYTYEAAVKNFELSIRNLRQAIPDAERVVAAAESDLAFQQKNYEAQKTKYQLGQLSESALRTVENDVLAAESALESARVSLFSAYHNYSWAINYGIVASSTGG